jgi:hypothetical protein
MSGTKILSGWNTASCFNAKKLPGTTSPRGVWGRTFPPRPSGWSVLGRCCVQPGEDFGWEGEAPAELGAAARPEPRPPTGSLPVAAKFAKESLRRAQKPCRLIKTSVGLARHRSPGQNPPAGFGGSGAVGSTPGFTAMPTPIPFQGCFPLRFMAGTGVESPLFFCQPHRDKEESAKEK